jgi:hypothetical protein
VAAQLAASQEGLSSVSKYLELFSTIIYIRGKAKRLKYAHTERVDEKAKLLDSHSGGARFEFRPEIGYSG